MQLTKNILAFKNVSLDLRARTDNIKLTKNIFLNYRVNFAASLLDVTVKPKPYFNMKGFFLESSVDTSIKSVPIFMFSLQRWEARETYISCFYADVYPALFEELTQKSLIPEDFGFFFNWFDHESIVPPRPEYQDEISNVFYYNEGRFLDYRIFDSTSVVADKKRRALYADYFGSRSITAAPKVKRFTFRNRFYKRKFDWFLKQYA